MYLLVLVLFYAIALLPFPLLYALSDGIYFILYYLVGYRKKVVLDNLAKSFPTYSEAARVAIAKKFYRNFCDQWLETIKLLTMNKACMNKRMVGNWEVLDDIYKEGLSCNIMMAHNFNWEWANIACQLNVQQLFSGVYMPITTPVFAKVMHKIRQRNPSSVLIAANKLKEGLALLKDQQYVFALVSDQNPVKTEIAQWEPFLNREAPFYRGPAQGAINAKAAVVFCHILKIKRGYYQFKMQRYCDNAATKDQETITRDFVQYAEARILEQPENWLWSHRRWKHSK
jgi:KDO2-lipid IV(A) lauroyltransferase